MPLFDRCPENPIIFPGGYPWRRATTFNPGVIFDHGRFYLFERAAGSLRPFVCAIGALTSDDGIHFTHVSDQPVLTPEMFGSPYGSVQDPRVVRLDDAAGPAYYMTVAYRPFAWSSHPTGVGVPDSHETDFPGVSRAAPDSTGASGNVSGGRPDNLTRSALAISRDLRHWNFHSFVSPPEIDDRNGILFPEKIRGQYALLRRPLHFVGPKYATPGASIWLSYSPDLRTWSQPTLLAKPEYVWEDNRIGGSTPPLRTPHGWLVLYHGVQTTDAACHAVTYRLGAMLLDLEDLTRILARTSTAIMEPETYYEKVGLYIPNVIFPTGLVLRDGLLYLYYGCCDTSIAMATCPLEKLLDLLTK
jgi:predicted GH43/DUF377 family glycosyl hydrolase